MNRKFSFSVGEFYHIYSRGTDKRNIFLDDNDRKRFQVLLYVSNNSKCVHLSNFQQNQGRTLMDLFDAVGISDRSLVDIGAYCLMPNHFHLMIREKSENGISRFMKKLLTGYSMYFNAKYERTGSLFESKFKARHVDTDEYLKYLFAYVHLNPVKLLEPTWKETGITKKYLAIDFLKKYQFSSYLDYLGVNRVVYKIINKDSFPGYFEKPKDFKEYVNWWLSLNRDENKIIKVGP
ncbi:MAG: transposase [Patescibacteria group bacterium]